MTGSAKQRRDGSAEQRARLKEEREWLLRAIVESGDHQLREIVNTRFSKLIDTIYAGDVPTRVRPETPMASHIIHDPDRFSLYRREDGRIGIWNPYTHAPATVMQVLPDCAGNCSTHPQPYWTDNNTVAERRIALLNKGRQDENV